MLRQLRLGMGCVVLMLTSGTVRGVGADSGTSRLTEILAELRLTPEGAVPWLERLGTHAGSARQTERLLLVTPAGKTILRVEGRFRQVPATDEMNALLHVPGARLVIVHNHPGSSGLSANDLRQLVKPGALAIVAIGHDGSVYAAAATPGYAGMAFERDQYRVVCGEVERRLRFYFSASVTPPWPLFEHIVATALAQAGAIEYHASLSADMRGIQAPIAPEIMRTAAAAAQRLRNDERKASRQEERAERLCGPANSALSQALANVQSRVIV